MPQSQSCYNRHFLRDSDVSDLSQERIKGTEKAPPIHTLFWESTIGLAGCGIRIWLFFVASGDTRDASSKQEREAGILMASGSGISYFYELGMWET